jgi:hypothetical protein
LVGFELQVDESVHVQNHPQRFDQGLGVGTIAFF